MDRGTAAVLTEFRRDAGELAREAIELSRLAETMCETAEEAWTVTPHRGRRHLTVVKGLLIGCGAASALGRKLAIGAGAVIVTASAAGIVAVPLITRAAPPARAAHLAAHSPRRRVTPVPAVAPAAAPAVQRRGTPPAIRPQPPLISPSPSPPGPSPSPLVSVSVPVPGPSPSPSLSVCAGGIICLGL